jgi:MoaA/NifB/PqqE/SkfB family radical SAM enzyme
MMITMSDTTQLYKKHNSFVGLYNANKDILHDALKRLKTIRTDANRYIGIDPSQHWILDQALSDILASASNKKAVSLKLTPHVAGEITSYSDDSALPRYLVHRYRYEIFPQTKTLEGFPPYLQLEPSSICNFRCVFCYQVDKSFSHKSQGHMGYMSLDLFRDAVDQAAGNIEFLSLASRGEPTLCPDFDAMMAYTTGKFLNLKVNTNASLLTEERCHSILRGGVKTLVISADAADEPLYSKLRVNGTLDKTIRNVERFQKIRESQYPKSEIITRVSGVKVSDQQNLDAMDKYWGGLVDQVAFVSYNPSFGEKSAYYQDRNDVTEACSDLWRRMYIWQNGLVNPCDVDYKSHLTVGNFPANSISDLWKSTTYTDLRKVHEAERRGDRTPCAGCVVV